MKVMTNLRSKIIIKLLFVLTDVSLMTKASQTVQQALSSKGFCDFQSKWVLVVTWYRVSRYRLPVEVQT